MPRRRKERTINGFHPLDQMQGLRWLIVSVGDRRYLNLIIEVIYTANQMVINQFSNYNSLMITAEYMMGISNTWIKI